MLEHSIYVVGTGHDIPDKLVRVQRWDHHDFYVGSFVQGQFVWHIYVQPHHFKTEQVPSGRVGVEK